MATSAPTITQIKEHFLAAQVLRLSTTLSPSAAFTAANAASDDPLDPRLVQAIATAVDGAVQDHCRRIYAPQATRAVAEQISHSYMREAERRIRRDDIDNEDGIGRELDLVDPNAIESLPAVWPQEREVTNHPMEAKRYADSVQRLLSLHEQRKELKLRVERLRRIKTTVDPLAVKENDNGLQENLVTRDGPVEKELEKMRMLLLRVTGRVGSLKATSRPDGDDAVKPLNDTRKRNIDDFLADPSVFPPK